MATVESRQDNAFPLDIRLKFWSAGGSTSQRYVQTTCVEPPHRAEVTSLCADPTDAVFVTAGGDGTFKIWARGKEGALLFVCTQPIAPACHNSSDGSKQQQ